MEKTIFYQKRGGDLLSRENDSLFLTAKEKRTRMIAWFTSWSSITSKMFHLSCLALAKVWRWLMWVKTFFRNAPYLDYSGSVRPRLSLWSTSLRVCSCCSVFWNWCAEQDCRISIIASSANPLSDGTEWMAHCNGFNICSNGLPLVFRNPILLPSFCQAINVLWTNMVEKGTYNAWVDTM